VTDLGSHAPDRWATAANTLIGIRDTIVQFCEDHPDFVKSIFELSAVILSAYTLHQICGATGDTALIVTAAIVGGEKLADIFSGWLKKKDDHPC
jgi:hypothetical protein